MVRSNPLRVGLVVAGSVDLRAADDHPAWQQPVPSDVRSHEPEITIHSLNERATRGGKFNGRFDMNRTIAAISTGLLLLSIPVSAEEPLDCLDANVAEALVLRLGGEWIRITRQWSPGFPRIALPAEFELIGSRTSAYLATVAFKSSLSMPESKARIQTILAGHGWKLLEIASPPPRVGVVFQVPLPVNGQKDMTFCHDDLGRMTARFTEAGQHSTYVMLDAWTGDGLNVCQAVPRGEVMQEALEAHFVELPQLTMPEDASAASGGGGSRGPDFGESSARLESRLTAAELLAHFGDQLTKQQWRQRSQWINEKISGSTWLSKDMSEAGVLTLIDRGGHRYIVGFQAARAQ